jgi:hypothetical protein
VNTFDPVEDSVLLLLRNGLYTESKLYTRKGLAYAKQGAGYVRLYPVGTTSINRLYWKELHSSLGKLETVGCDLRWIPASVVPVPLALAAE